ncbi:type IV secretion system protein [Haematobacter genomosp. 1]|uniref:type IV secretion system protein n=1 Tax=Haematobacter genomosp. 1 TaxID=366618 RepID=UPI0015C60B8B|nr:type IV secretion system protein [Haematobacter genomosp. 1]
MTTFFGKWANFSLVYDALTNTPAEIGSALLAGLGVEHEGNLYEGLDGVYGKVLDVSNSIAESGGYVSGAISALVIFLIAALMATVAVFVLGIAKIGIAIFGVIASAMIACALFPPTLPIFKAWVKQAITFSFIPLLVTAVSGVVLVLFDFAAPGSLTGISTLGEAISFVVVAMVGTGMLLQVPSMAGSFGQTMVAVGAVAANAYANAKGLPGGARDGGARVVGMVKAGASVSKAFASYVVAPAAAAAGTPAAGAAAVARGLSAAESRKASAK